MGSSAIGTVGGAAVGALFGALSDDASDETWDETGDVIDDLRREQPKVPPASLGFRLGGKKRHLS